MKAIKFNNVSCGYSDQNVLENVSFSVSSGEVVGLVGRNGAGKTTLIKSAMGMLHPKSGSIEVLGLDPFNTPVLVKERVGYVSEEQILPPFLKTLDVMNMHKSLFPKTWDDKLARELAGTFNLPADKKIKALSKGQARQVALVCAVAHKPELLILDEPAGGLDPSARREFLETSISFLNECGSTILFSSHYMSDVERMSNRILLIHKGAFLLDRDLDNLKEEFALAMIPEVEGINIQTLKDLETCLSVRQRGSILHAVFERSQDETRKALDEKLGLRGIQIKTMYLEELFIELTGGRN